MVMMTNGQTALFWGMINSVQIMAMFPLSSPYFPYPLEFFLRYFRVSLFDFDWGLRTEYIDRFNIMTHITDKFDVSEHDWFNWEEEGYENLAFLSNFANLFQIISLCSLFAITVLASKGIFYTIQSFRNLPKAFEGGEKDKDNSEEDESSEESKQDEYLGGTSEYSYTENDHSNTQENITAQIQLYREDTATSHFKGTGIKDREFKLGENSDSDEVNEDDDDFKSRPESTNACHYIAEKTAELTRLLKWNFFIRAGLEIYLEVCVVTFISFGGVHFGYKNPVQFLSLLLTGLGVAYILFFLIWIPIFTVKNIPKFRIQGKRFEKQWYPIVGEYKPNSYITLFYTFFFIIRRILMALVLVFLRWWVFAQVTAMVILLIPYVIYQIVVRPYRWTYVNAMMIWNECQLLVLAAIFYLYTYETSSMVPTYIAWGLMFEIMFNLIVNMIFIWIQIAINCYRWYKQQEIICRREAVNKIGPRMNMGVQKVKQEDLDTQNKLQKIRAIGSATTSKTLVTKPIRIQRY